MLTFLDQGLKLFLKPRERIFAEPRRSRASNSSGTEPFLPRQLLKQRRFSRLKIDALD